MTVLDVELAILIVAVVAVAVVVAVTHSRTVALIGERQKAMDSYVKSLGREKLTVTREAQKALDEAQKVREEARGTFRRVEQHLSDPRVKRLIDG